MLGLGDYKEAGEGGNSTNSGPASGSQSASSTGGEGGGAPKPCEKDADCSNGKFCDGAEHCGDDNQCSPGTPPCPPPTDTAHCVTSCTEGNDAAICGAVVAIDADGDLHGDPLCAQAPGDDCDETNPARFPGNPEICDAIDNDCNLFVDEGLPATGASVELGSGPEDAPANAHVGFSPGLSLYATAWVDDVDFPDIRVKYSGHDGVVTADQPLGSWENNQLHELRPRVAGNDTEFAVVWHDENVPNGGIYMSLVSPTGGIIADHVHASDLYDEGYSPDIVTTPSGDFIVVWAEPVSPPDVSILAQRVLADGTLSGNIVNIADNTRAKGIHIARNGNNYAVVWNDVEGTNNVVKARAFSDTFVVATQFTLVTTTLNGEPAISTQGAGYAIAWPEATNTLGVALYDAALTQTAINQSTTDVRGPLSIAATASEVMVLESNSNVAPEPTTRIHRFDNALVSLGDPLQVSEGNQIEDYTGLSTILETPLGVAVVWGNVLDGMVTEESIWFRGMGTNVCD